MERIISVVGLGKLGAPLAACLAARGMCVIAVDVDLAKVNAVNRGHAPVYEPQLEEFMGRARGRLTATHDIAAAVSGSDVTFVVVGTPSEPDGSFSLRYVLPVCEEIGHALRTKRGFHLVVLTSTVMPGMTGGPVRGALERASGKVAGRDFGLCYGPEFIALGSVIRDFLNPDFVLIGESDPRSGAMLEALYQEVCENGARAAHMNFVNAEITKLSVNTFVTTKISFANMLARICERMPEANVDVVTSALGLDARIGARYLKGAVSYGGPCFPRDNRALVALGREVGVPAALAEATDRFNSSQIGWLADLVESECLLGETAGILGLTYKPDTDVTEFAVGHLLAQELARRAIHVVVYDPAANMNSSLGLDKNVRFAATAQECIEQADVIILATVWKEFCRMPAEQWRRQGRPRTLIDCWRALEHLERCDGVRYLPLGVGSLPTSPRVGAEIQVLNQSKEPSMLTLFALPKAFKGHFGMIQRNAISQWARLRPRPEILLFGSEEGTAEIARELGLRHIPEVKCNEYGTPLLNDLFEKADALASHDTLCYVNADIMLLGSFMEALQRVVSWRDRFLVVGARTDVDLDEPAIYESADQEGRLRALISRHGRLAPACAIDYFAFPRGLFPIVPPFAIGRTVWDNWLLWKARKLGVPLVDASEVVLAVHQNHDFSHHPQGWQGVRQGEEAEQNWKLAKFRLRTIEDATHKLTSDGIKYNFGRLRPSRAVLPWWVAFLKVTGPIRHLLGLRREKIASMLGRIGMLSSR